ncbi:hypothetical protein QJQ45_029766, partial [Haematococcus lacustris]
DLSCGPRCTRPLGQLPGQLSALGALEVLSLSGNQLGGPLPGVGSRTFVAGTPNLQVLDLSRNSFSGPLPSHYLTWTRLTSLNLSSNALTGVLPPSWGGMSTLTDLILDNNQLSGQMPVEWRALSPQSSGSLLLLNLQNNCALCGALPPLPQGTLVLLKGSALGFSCNANNCVAGFLPQIVIGVGAACLLLALCLVIRLTWRQFAFRILGRQPSDLQPDPPPSSGLAPWRLTRLAWEGPIEGGRQRGPGGASGPRPSQEVRLRPVFITLCLWGEGGGQLVSDAEVLVEWGHTLEGGGLESRGRGGLGGGGQEARIGSRVEVRPQAVYVWSQGQQQEEGEGGPRELGSWHASFGTAAGAAAGGTVVRARSGTLVTPPGTLVTPEPNVASEGNPLRLRGCQAPFLTEVPDPKVEANQAGPLFPLPFQALVLQPGAMGVYGMCLGVKV